MGVLDITDEDEIFKIGDFWKVLDVRGFVLDLLPNAPILQVGYNNVIDLYGRSLSPEVRDMFEQVSVTITGDGRWRPNRDEFKQASIKFRIMANLVGRFDEGDELAVSYTSWKQTIGNRNVRRMAVQLYDPSIKAPNVVVSVSYINTEDFPENDIF